MFNYVKHHANIGDAIATMCAMKSYYEKTGRRIVFCQQLNVPATYYEGAVHPVKDDQGTMVMCNERVFKMIRPLLLAQDYIHDVEVYNGQKIDADIDLIRKEIFVNIPHQAIQQWPFIAFPDLATDISRQWIFVPPVDISDCYLTDDRVNTVFDSIDFFKEKVIVNFTERYRNKHLSYFFLRHHEKDLIFSGTRDEHKAFCKEWEIRIPRIITTDFLQLAYILKNSKFMIGNQSFLWNVAEAMKTPRILELCQYAPNCQAFYGEHSYGYHNQKGLECYFPLLKNR